MTKTQRLKEPEWKAPCLTETCDNLSGHSSGLCPTCRTIQCATCGGSIVKQASFKKNQKCAACSRKKESETPQMVRLRD